MQQYVAEFTLKWEGAEERSESHLVSRRERLRGPICDFIDNKVVIQWDDGQETLDEALEEAGLPNRFLLVGYNNECLVNRPLLNMGKLEEQITKLRKTFSENVTEWWNVVVKVK
jgi:hypothetical protein